MKLLTAIFGFSLALLFETADGLIFDSLFAFPSTRRGRATPPASVGSSEFADDPLFDSISIGKDTSQNDDIIQQLMRSVMQSAAAEEPPRPAALKEYQAELLEESPGVIQLNRPQMPRRVDEMKHFGEALDTDDVLFHESGLPQLATAATSRDDDAFLDNGAPDVMNLRSDAFLRQNDEGTPIAPSSDDSAPAVVSASDTSASGGDNNEMRCVPKVMQIEETVYDREIKCHHTFREKCHTSYITEYKSSTQEKCETSFKKNCHITFKAMPFNETLNICHTPIVRKCSNDSVGPDICSTHYETHCETKYTTYEVEQDEPVCRMEIMKKCQDVTIPLSSRRGRQFGLADASGESTAAAAAATATAAADTNAEAANDDSTADQNVVTVDQKCEEWPVKKCSVEKRMVKKVHPETECKKIPRQVCIPNNCQMVEGDQICRDEMRVQIQKVPEEECELQPEENCQAEAVLVPRLVPKPACVKVPQEICVKTKVNPRRVKKPVVKQWCYNPKDLKDLKASNIVPNEVSQSNLPGEAVSRAGTIFSRLSRLLFNNK